ncbi:DUF3800 domain-containing protein [Methanococcus sp. CF]
MYIDESGDLGLKGSNYMVLSALVVRDPENLNRIIKNMRRNKFKKELSGVNEIKAYNSSPELKKYMLKKLNEVPNSGLYYTVLELHKCYSEFLNGDNHKKYNFIAGELAKNVSVNCNNLEVRIDKSKGKQVLRDDFNQYFESKLRENSTFNSLKIEHSNSHSYSGLQFADLLAWSVFRKYERNDSEYFDMLTINKKGSNVFE